MKLLGLMLMLTSVLLAGNQEDQGLLASSPAAPGVPASRPTLPGRLALVDASPTLPGYSAPVPAQPTGRRFYQWSLVAVMGASAADAASSWGQMEANPVLSQQRATFGGESLAIKYGLLGAALLIEKVALRHNPHLYKAFGWLNISLASGMSAAAAHNMAIR